MYTGRKLQLALILSINIRLILPLEIQKLNSTILKNVRVSEINEQKNNLNAENKVENSHQANNEFEKIFKNYRDEKLRFHGAEFHNICRNNLQYNQLNTTIGTEEIVNPLRFNCPLSKFIIVMSPYHPVFLITFNQFYIFLRKNCFSLSKPNVT